MGYSAEAEPGPTSRDRVRSGPVRAAVDRMLRDWTGKRTTAQAIASLEASQLVNAMLAQRYAGAVDRAADAVDDVRLVSAGEKLRNVLEALEPKPDPTPEGGSPDVGSTGPSGRIAHLFSGRPTLGDAADA